MKIKTARIMAILSKHHRVKLKLTDGADYSNVTITEGKGNYMFVTTFAAREMDESQVVAFLEENSFFIESFTA